MSLSRGQRLALRQVGAVAAARPLALEVVRVVEPSEPGGDVLVDVSVSCVGFEQRAGGIALHARERLLLFVGPGFPFAKPEVYTRHTRWAGTPHVQWGKYLCLYQAPTVEWVPSDGMFGFFERLELWLRQAALGELDPTGGPLHPPVAYRTSGTPLVIPRRDTPEVGDEPWLGWVACEAHGSARIDLTDWTPIRDEAGKFNVPTAGSAAAFLLPGELDWEYPKHTVALLVALIRRGVSYANLMFHLKFSAAAVAPGQPLFVVLGTAMRGTRGGTRRQHLAVWRLPGAVVDDLRRALGEYLDDEALRAAGEQADERAFDYLTDSKLEWCGVREDRPEIVTRRDDRSPMRSFAGKAAMVWGCGALGAPVAEWVARAGARKLIVVDYASVTPGVLVRQPFVDADIGRTKATVLAERLKAIRPDLQVVPETINIHALLDRDAWHADVDVLLDCSANLSVQTKLELVARERPATATHLACLLLGHTAERGIAVLAAPGHAGATADVLRSVKLSCLRRRDLRGFAAEFWPSTPRSEHFQPEPGCSDATFRGSGAEAGAVAGVLLSSIAQGLDSTSGTPASAMGHLFALPGCDHDGATTAHLTFDSATVTRDAEGEYEIRLAPSALAEMRGWVASAARRLGAASETGGLIFGQRDEAAGVIWVQQLTGPPPDSIESPEEFVCGTQGVSELCEANTGRGHGSIEFLGIWHTHPDQQSAPSRKDLQGIVALSAAAPSPLSRGLILIVGDARALTEPDGPHTPDLSVYVFDGVATHNELAIKITAPATVPLPARQPPAVRDVGVALSGGGSRAIAFHLGCLRALHDRGVLDRVQVMSGVSGGSVLTALYCYSGEDFDAFDARVCELLRGGLQAEIARRALLSPRLVEAGATRLIAGSAAAAARTVGFAGRKVGRHSAGNPPLRRWVSRTDAFVDVLADRLFGDTRMDDERRDDLGVVINACDLTTGSAFRFGSRESGTWRVGRVVDNQVRVAEAVGASAAYPLALPALDRRWRFTPMRGGDPFDARVVLTDGGVFDNLGTSCLEPGRSDEFSTNVYAVDYIIACDAGRGLLHPQVPFGPLSRVSRSFLSTFRKAQDATRSRLHHLVEHGELQGFVMPYLGQSDRSLPHMPADLITRDQVADYPTNFAAMSDQTIAFLAGRGQQLTRLLIEQWCPEL